MILTVAVVRYFIEDFGRHSVYWVVSPPLSLNPLLNGLFQKKTQEFFLFFTLLLKIPDKKLNPWIFHEIVLDPLEISRPKTKTPETSTLFFLGHA